MAPPIGFKPTIFALEERCIFSYATEAYWCLMWDSNPQNPDFESGTSTSCINQTGVHCGTCGETRTHTAYVLSVVPPAIGLHRHIVVIQKRFELLFLQGLSLMHLPIVLLDDGTHGEIRTLKRHRV